MGGCEFFLLLRPYVLPSKNLAFVSLKQTVDGRSLRLLKSKRTFTPFYETHFILFLWLSPEVTTRQSLRLVIRHFMNRVPDVQWHLNLSKILRYRYLSQLVYTILKDIDIFAFENYCNIIDKNLRNRIVSLLRDFVFHSSNSDVLLNIWTDPGKMFHVPLVFFFIKKIPSLLRNHQWKGENGGLLWYLLIYAEPNNEALALNWLFILEGMPVNWDILVK